MSDLRVALEDLVKWSDRALRSHAVGDEIALMASLEDARAALSASTPAGEVHGPEGNEGYCLCGKFCDSPERLSSHVAIQSALAASEASDDAD